MDKTHKLIIVVEQLATGQMKADITFDGNPHEISKAMCGFLQKDLQFRTVIMEAIMNAINEGGAVKVASYEKNSKAPAQS